MRRSVLSLPVLLAACDAADGPHDAPFDDSATDVVDTSDDLPTDDTGGATSDETADTGDDAPFEEATFDATDRTSWVYVDLSTGEALDLDATSAASSTDWHLAIRRFDIRTNGGESGPGAMAVGLSSTPAGLYDTEGDPVVSAFQGLTDETAEMALLDDAREPERWEADAVDRVLGDAWYRYDVLTGDVTEDDSQAFLVRGGEGTSHARMVITDLDFPTRAGMGITAFTATFDVQGVGEQGFADAPVTFTTTLGPGGGTTCYDWDADATVACAGTSWDVQLGFLGRDFFLVTNGGDVGEGSGGALGPYDRTELDTWTSAVEDPDGNDVSGFYEADVSTSLIQRAGWYAYGLSGGFRLWPNARVWLVDADTEDDESPMWAVQVADYYDAQDTSGYVTLRWRLLDDHEPVSGP